MEIEDEESEEEWDEFSTEDNTQESTEEKTEEDHPNLKKIIPVSPSFQSPNHPIFNPYPSATTQKSLRSKTKSVD